MDPVIKQTDFQFPGQTQFYRGKVRDVYEINDDYLVMIATDRISAFDVILPRAIPYKGEVLNQLGAQFLNATADIVPNWLMEVPDPAVSIGLKCDPIPVEMVVRGYLCGHAWREYKAGKVAISGVALPKEMHQFEPFPEPIITPTTKSQHGHDLDISKEAIIHEGLVDEVTYEKLETYSKALFQKGQEHAHQQGLILADTKYEFGIHQGQVYLIDEIHTPDSSRYFYREGFGTSIKNDGKPQQLSKEFVREWLMEQGFQGQEGLPVPEMGDSIVQEIMNRYIELFEKVTGAAFELSDRSSLQNRLHGNVLASLKALK